MKMKTGEYIPLYWDEYCQRPYYINGHVSLVEECARLVAEGEAHPVTAVHKYGRMVKIGKDHDECLDGRETVFRVLDQPRKSYYPVTECWAAKEQP